MHDGHHDHETAGKRDHDAPLTDYQRMEIAVRELLIEKGVVTAEEIRGAVEAMDARSPALGARVVARAWSDPAFKARLLAGGDCRLLTVLGPGGIGKSSLAWQAMHRLAPQFPGGHSWVELHDLSTTTAVAARIAERLGVQVPAGADALTQIARHVWSEASSTLIPCAALSSCFSSRRWIVAMSSRIDAKIVSTGNGSQPVTSAITIRSNTMAGDLSARDSPARTHQGVPFVSGGVGSVTGGTPASGGPGPR